jgi:hypothetical protein
MSPNITQPNTLQCGAEFDAAPMWLRGGLDASSGGSIFLAPPRFGPLMTFFCFFAKFGFYGPKLP